MVQIEKPLHKNIKIPIKTKKSRTQKQKNSDAKQKDAKQKDAKQKDKSPKELSKSRPESPTKDMEDLPSKTIPEREPTVTPTYKVQEKFLNWVATRPRNDEIDNLFAHYYTPAESVNNKKQ